MTLPTGPVDGQIAIEPTTQRQFIWASADGTWTPYLRTDLFEFSDIDPTLPSDPLHKLLWDESLGKYTARTTKNTEYVEAIVKEELNQPPTPTDVEEPGTMWTLWVTNQHEEAYIAAYTNPAKTETVWRKIGAEPGEWERPALPIQGTAPTSPVLGSLWFDNSGGPIVKKYWDGAAWQTLL